MISTIWTSYFQTSWMYIIKERLMIITLISTLNSATSMILRFQINLKGNLVKLKNLKIEN